MSRSTTHPPTESPSGSDLDRSEMAATFREVRSASDALCAPLETEDYVVQSMPDVSPTKWHLAHTSWFFETFVLRSFYNGYTGFDPHFNYLFNSYYNTVGRMHARPQRGLLTRPPVKRVFEYRAHVDTAIGDWLRETREITDEAPAILRLGLHHEQQHQELMLMDLKHVFSCNPLLPVYRAEPPADTTEAASRPAMRLAFDSGIHEVGHDGRGFAFDNEIPRHRCYLEPFRIADRCVTNTEYLAFIEDGGYRRHELWLADGWDEISRNGWKAPLYWRRQEDGWEEFTLSGSRPLRPAEPVCHVSYYEADAYARWVGARLPREEEWEVAAEAQPLDGNFVEQGRLHPAPAASNAGQFFGDVWEWTASPYVPYPGYRAAEGALGEYNGKFMCNQIVMRGGCCATPRSHIRRTYRNFFYPRMRWQFGGIRLAWDAE